MLFGRREGGTGRGESSGWFGTLGGEDDGG